MPCMGDPPSFYHVEEMTALEHTSGVSHWVVAFDIRDVFEVLAKGDFSDAVKVRIRMMSGEEAARCRTHDDEGKGRDTLDKWPVGTLLSENY